MTAAGDIALVAGERPVVVDLARVLSLASHIDVALVRALRLALFADSDVSTEADLWSSALVEARGEGDLVLRGDVRAALWDDLRADADLLEAHRTALSEARTDSPPLMQLEERLAYHALAGDLAAIDRELRTVIAAMRDEPDRRRNLAAWSAQALDHLPAEVRETEAARILGNVARSWVATPIQIAAMTPDVDSMDIVQSLQADTGARVSIYLRRLGDTLEVSTTPESLSVEISDVPVNNPVLFVDHDQSWPLDLRGITSIPVEGPRIMLGTPDKRRWWLEPEQEQPNVNAIRTTSDNDDGVAHTLYLVRPDQAVTTARWLADPRPTVSFGGWRPVAIVAVDDDADIALVRLREPVRDPALEFDPDVRQGQSWQAFPFGNRIVGTIATAWPGVTIRIPTGVTTALPPGTPIFSGTKVIGHVGSEPPRDGVVHIVSARLIQWWLAEVAKSHAPATEGRQTAEHIMSTPNTFSASMFSDEEQNADGQNAAEQNVEQSTVEQTGSQTEESMQQTASRSGEPRVWVRSSRSIEVPPELTIHSVPDISRGDLVVLFVSEGELRWPGAVYRVVREREIAQLTAQYNMQSSGPESRAELAVHLPRPDDDVLRANQRDIAECADVTALRDARSLGIHERLIELLWRLQGVDDDQSGLGGSLPMALGGPAGTIRSEARATLRRLFGPPEDVASMPVVIELPARISTGGLLGTTLAHDGTMRRFRRHQWGPHEVTLVTDSKAALAVPEPRIRIRITDVEVDPQTAAMEFAARLFRNRGKEAFYDACLTPPPGFSTEVVRGPRRSGTPGLYDLELIVNRAPKVPAAHAHRRGVQFVAAVLDKMSGVEAPMHVVLRVPGSGALDLVDAQQRVRADDDRATVLWIDPETELVTLRYDLESVPQSVHALDERSRRAAAALGAESADVIEIGEPSDPIARRFGGARARAGRQIDDVGGEPARVSVSATDDSPVRGHVTFYATGADDRIMAHRKRAIDGVATCELARSESGFVVGAVIEDEGVIVECLVGPIGGDGEATTGTEVA
jgi:hypothetical protein